MDERDENGGAGEYADIDFGYECDLHFFEPRETAAVVREFIRQATQKGLSTVRLVHGKGKSAKKRDAVVAGHHRDPVAGEQIHAQDA
ncbi:MAG TPA: Smr/MutS family protein, partial [Spirochaetota bacterium]|nr:Smr/MutS family protein [Spirochaetota bacterium]